MSSYSLPTIGLRIVKTAVTAFLIMFLFRILHLGRSPFYAMIASILSMQSDLSNSKRTALNRAFGTTVGASFAAFLTMLEIRISAFTREGFLYLVSVIICITAIIYVTVIFHMTTASYISCVVFLSATVVSRGSDGGPFLFVLFRFSDTLFGVFLSYVINWIHIPQKKRTDILFTSGLDQILLPGKSTPSAYTIRELNHLIGSGANFTLSTSHTPAAILKAAENLHLQLPVIAMDGAVLYDIGKNQYLLKYMMSRQTVSRIEHILDDKNFHFFENVIVDDVLLIYYQDFKTPQQREYYEKQRISPLHNYMRGKRSEKQHVISFTLLDDTTRLNALISDFNQEGLDRNCRFLLKKSEYENQALLHILCKNARKENMNHYLQKKLNLPKTISFGDYKDTCDITVESKDSDQVAKTVKKLYSKK